MGRDKALLPWAGTTLLGYQIEKMKALECFDAVWVSGDYPGYPCVRDRGPAGGPVSGIHAAAVEAGLGSVIVVLPVDMPLIERASLQALLAEPGAAVLGDGPMPCRLPVTAALLEKTTGSVRSLLAELGPSRVPVSRPGELRGMNDAGEYAALRGYNGS